MQFSEHFRSLSTEKKAVQLKSLTEYRMSSVSISVMVNDMHRMQMALIALSILAKYFNYIKKRDIVPVG